MVLVEDLLNPSAASEATKHKLKRLVQSPNSFFMDVKCPGCVQITTVFSHAQTVVVCASCATVLCQPTGGRARLTEGCSFRKKVGARGYIRTAPLSSGKKVYKIDCSVPVRDNVFDADLLAGFEQYFAQNIKLHGRKGKLGDKVKVALDKETNVLSVSTTMQYRKNYFKYLCKKFLKKKNMRDYFRVIATAKTDYQLRYFNMQQEE